MGLPESFPLEGVVEMKKPISVILLVVVASMPVIIPVFAQDSMSLWPFFVDVLPRPGTPGIFDFVVPLEVMDKSREDLADLRLYNGLNREVPYALRVRKAIDQEREVEARTFNQAKIGTTTSEMSVDLGENAGEHNEVEIATSGSNFRRRVEVEGSDSGKEWHTLKTGEVILSFEAQNKHVESTRVGYSASRYRFLRVRVLADELTDKQAPVITGVKVMMVVRENEELTAWSVSVPPYQLLRNQGASASSWTFDLGGRVPCDRLALEANDESFSRPFQIEVVDDPQNIRLVASGELTRRIGEERRPLVITFDAEVHARKLRLLITDYSNQALAIRSLKPGSPARQIVFELKDASTQPLRLFFGNLKAGAPHYDFEKDLPAKLSTEPVRSKARVVAENPDYKPETLPLTERIPWLIYIVLTASSLALAVILIGLARATVRVEAQQREEP